MDEEKELLAEKTTPFATVDQVIEQYVGSFGFSQLLQVFFVSLAWIFDSQSTMLTIFTDAQPDSLWCIGPECSVEVCGLKQGSWEWSTGNTSTIVTEWGLICDRRFLAAVPMLLYFLGSLLGYSFYGRLADASLGRKRSLLLSCLLTSATIYLTSLSPNLCIYSLLRFANGFSRSGIGICSLLLCTEAVGLKSRNEVGQYGFFFYAAGYLSIPLIAYPTRYCWRDLHKVISFFPLVYTIFILIPFVSESPRWLLVRERREEALGVLKRYARMNGKELPLNLTLIADNIEETNLSLNKLRSTKWAVERMAVVMIMGLGIGFVYYGIQLNVENLNFDLYFTVAMNAMMEIPAVFFSSVLLSFTNRRLLFSCSAFLAGISYISCIIFSNKNEKQEPRSRGSLPQLMTETLGFIASSTSFNVLYIYCVELFPTNLRNLAVSLLRQCFMLGASISPLLVVLGRSSPSLSFFVVGMISIVTGLFSLWLPETRNSPLYETLEQQEEEQRFDCACRDLRIELFTSNLQA